MGISRGNWADLPIEILDEMLTKVGDVEDFIRFGDVCHSWRCASVVSKNNFVPWMMLSEPEPPHNFLDQQTVMLINMFNEKEEEEESENDIKQDVRRFINVLNKKTIELYLPEAEGRRCFGSKYGWILTIGLDLNIHLLNPLTRIQIPLPPQPTFQNYIHTENKVPYDQNFRGEPEIAFVRRTCLDKFALSSHPNHHQEFVVMVIYSTDRKLAFTRPGNSAWTDVKCHREWFDDVIFFKNLFYAVDSWGAVVVCDITSPVPVATDFMPPPVSLQRFYRHYLVEMSGNLHIIVRIIDGSNDDVLTTIQFRVYKLDFHRKKWIKLKHLRGHTLFLGNNCSFAINHPQLPSNCIYFTDDHWEHYKYRNRDLGLFDFVKSKIVDPFYSGDGVCSTFCTPLFFMPNLH